VKAVERPVDRGREEREVLTGVGTLRVDLVELVGLGQEIDRAAGLNGPLSGLAAEVVAFEACELLPLAGRSVAAELPQALNTQKRRNGAERQGAQPPLVQSVHSSLPPSIPVYPD
jgi:hypothetical protein